MEKARFIPAARKNWAEKRSFAECAKNKATSVPGMIPIIVAKKKLENFTFESPPAIFMSSYGIIVIILKKSMAIKPCFVR